MKPPGCDQWFPTFRKNLIGFVFTTKQSCLPLDIRATRSFGMSQPSKCHEAIICCLLGPRSLCLKQNYKGMRFRNTDASIQVYFWVSQSRTNGCGLPKRDSTPAKGIDSCSQTSSETRAASATMLTGGAGVYNCYSVNNKCISFVRITKMF